MSLAFYRCSWVGTGIAHDARRPLVADFGVPFVIVKEKGTKVIVLVSSSDHSALEGYPGIFKVARDTSTAAGLEDVGGPAVAPPKPKLTQAQRKQWEEAFYDNPMGLRIEGVWSEHPDFDQVFIFFYDGDKQVGRQQMQFYSPHVLHSPTTEFLPEYQNAGQYRFMEKAELAVMMEWGMEKLTMDVVPGNAVAEMFKRNGWREDPDNPAILYGDITGNYFGDYD